MGCLRQRQAAVHFEDFPEKGTAYRRHCFQIGIFQTKIVKAAARQTKAGWLNKVGECEQKLFWPHVCCLLGVTDRPFSLSVK